MLIPSIDISMGKTVQLEQGQKIKIERNDTEKLADFFTKYCDTAVIDIDRAKGVGTNEKLIKRLCKKGRIRVGGGIRSVETAYGFIKEGAEKIIIGTSAYNSQGLNKDFLKKLNEKIGKNRIMVAVDIKKNAIQTHGWQNALGLNYQSVLPELEKYCYGALVTIIDNEGLMTGLSEQTLNKIRKLTNIPITIAGGVKSIEDISKAKKFNMDVQIGMALYTKQIDFFEALTESLNWEKSSLLTAITKDIDGNILMCAKISRSSFLKTLKTNTMWYFSQSRQKLWKKGETSGNEQILLQLKPDCDNDCVLFTVKQKGVACHTGNDTCFGKKEFGLKGLQQILKEKLQQKDKNSYSASLTKQKIKQKLIEEAGETALASSKPRIIYESADLLYFLTLLLTKENIDISEVFQELNSRRKK